MDGDFPNTVRRDLATIWLAVDGGDGDMDPRVKGGGEVCPTLLPSARDSPASISMSRTRGTPITVLFMACLMSLILWSCFVALRFIVWPKVIGSVLGFGYNRCKKINSNQKTNAVKFLSTEDTKVL